MTQKPFSIAIDGPAGAGKSTVAKAVAEALGAVYLDTGAMYRTVGLFMHEKGFDSIADIADSVCEANIGVEFMEGRQHMFLDGADVTEAIRSPEASMLASKVGGVAQVRTRLVELQREFAQGHSVVMDGRDIGTDVLPNATLKIFLTASCEVRAERRFQELAQKGVEESYDQVLREIIQRDYNDMHREVSPMRQAEDAIYVDTSLLTVQDAVNRIVEEAEKRGVKRV